MTLPFPKERVSPLVQRSQSSTTINPPTLTPHQRPYSRDDSSRRVHLIQSDLWEAITGEHLSPDNICEMCEISMPAPESTLSPAALQTIGLAKDRQGSRGLQQKIAECSDDERNIIFTHLFSDFAELVNDPAANYVIQKLCEYATDEQQAMILEFFIPRCHDVIEHHSGCRVLQRFIECTSHDNVDALFLELKADLIPLCRSPNGNHIVQRFIETLPNRLEEIIGGILPHVIDLVVDNCGCRVVQRLFDQFDISRLRPLVQAVLAAAADLANNQYGNYVVQSILESGPEKDIDALIDAFKTHFYDFSIHKFASNVIEKCIRRATAEQRNEIFNEIIGINGKYENAHIHKMVADQFGNYVIQRILEFGSEEQQSVIAEVVFEHYQELSTKPYARHVIGKLQNLEYQF